MYGHFIYILLITAFTLFLFVEVIRKEGQK